MFNLKRISDFLLIFYPSSPRWDGVKDVVSGRIPSKGRSIRMEYVFYVPVCLLKEDREYTGNTENA